MIFYYNFFTILRQGNIILQHHLLKNALITLITSNPRNKLPFFDTGLHFEFTTLNSIEAQVIFLVSLNPKLLRPTS